jgi:hypothetical protein
MRIITILFLTVIFGAYTIGATVQFIPADATIHVVGNISGNGNHPFVCSGSLLSMPFKLHCELQSLPNLDAALSEPQQIFMPMIFR